MKHLSAKVTFIICMVLASSLCANEDEGIQIFKQELRKACGFSGNVMAKMHMQKEWQVLFDSGQLSMELQKICPESKPLKSSYLKPMYNFLYYYAKDSGNTALCY